ncbi:MAG TPA: antibiotic biosynthesis monooxygenase [Acidimicrobiales bacterium]|nr:antibiotic biosynthesis monooxygenase [Acidimicrobiales bacterium]
MTVALITRLVVHPSAVARAVAVFSDMEADVLANEPGTVEYRYYQSTSSPCEFWVHEVFADEAAKQVHLGRHAQRRADFDAILAEPPEFNAVAPLR